MDAVSAHVSSSETADKCQTTPRERVIGLLDVLVFHGILATILLTSIPNGTVEPWWIALFECSVFALAAIWIVQGTLLKTWRLTNRLLLLPPAAMLLFAFIQTLTLWGSTLSRDPYQTRLWVLQVGALILTGAMLLHYTSTGRRVNSLVAVVIVVGTLSALFGLTRQALNLEIPIFGFLPLSEQGAYAQFINRNHFAMLMEISLGLIAGIIVAAGIRGVSLAPLLLVAIVLWVALVLSNSRGGIVAMLGQILFLAAFWRGRKPKSETNPKNPERSWSIRSLLPRSVARLLLAASLITVVGIGVVWVGGDSLVHRWEILPRELKTQTASRDNSSRLAIWKATLGMIRDHPLVGVGFGGYRASLPNYHDASGTWIPQEAHNDYLELAASGGVIGVALLLTFVAALIKLSKRCLSASSDHFRRASCLGAQVGLVGVAIHSFVDFGLHVTINAVLFVVLVVIATRITPTGYDSKPSFRPVA